MNISYRTIAKLIAVVFALLLVMSAQVVMADNQLKDGGSETLTLKPKEQVGKATGRVEINSTQIDDFNDDGDHDGDRDLDNDTGGFDDNGDGFDDNGDDFNDNGDFGNDGLDDDTGDFDQDGNDNGDDFDDNGDDFNDNGDNDQNGRIDEVQITGNVQIDNLADRNRVEAFLIDNEGGQSINLGKLTEDGAQLRLNFNDTVNNVEDFDRVVITREPENDPDPLPSGDVLFNADLPH